MGGAASNFHNTDWEKADGGLKDASETFDGAKPTEAYSLFYLTKKGSPVNQRDCEMRDEDNTRLYTTAGVEGTTKDFDFLVEDKKLFHVHTSVDHSKWMIYSYTPVYAGQTATTTGDTLIKVQEPLYNKASVAITWNKYHGVIHLYEPSMENSTSITEGGVSTDHLLHIEEIQSITPQFQSFIPSKMSLMHPELIGYWVREHTAKTDRTKMHLAKGTDIALHCILAVIANLVHVERQANKS